MPVEERERPVEPPEQAECCDCNESVDREHTIVVNGDRYCEPCHDDNFYSCNGCSESVHNDRVYYAYQETYCEHCYFEYFENCYDCEEPVERDGEVYWRNDNPYCSDCVPNDIDDMLLYLDDREPPACSRKAESFEFPVRRLVGVEVECLIPHIDALDTPSFWTSTNDGSINSEEGYDGIEMVSYPASGDLLLESIDNLMSWSNDIGAIVNRSCGLHVHFNSLDLTARQVAHVGIVYRYFEEILKGMMPNSRQSSNWCKDFPIPKKQLRHITEESELIEMYYDYMDSQPSADKYNDARYCGLNIHSRYYHGSLEFRLHSGTINKTKILNWIQILNRIIDMAIDLERYTGDEYDKWIGKSPLTNMSSTFGVELCDYINKRNSKFIGGRVNE